MGIPQLTFLRFIAASAVVIFHFGREVPSLSWGATLWPYANTAVSFFFVLSGFILAHVYGLRGIHSPREFYISRLARIAPLYWIALALVAGYSAYKSNLDATSLILGTSMIQAWVPGYALSINSPGWSLSVELAFYIFFPLLLRSLQSIERTSCLFGVMVGAWVGNQVLHITLMSSTELQASAAGHDFTVYSPATHFATFVVGVAGGLVFNRHQESIQRFASPLIAVSVASLFLFFTLPNPLLDFHHNGFPALLFLMLIWGLSASTGRPLARLMSKRAFVLLGEASFGVYILQMPVNIVHTPLAMKLQWGTELTFWSFYFLLLLTSLLSFLLIESPLRKRIKLFLS